MQIWWTRFESLAKASRARGEQRLHDLERGHGDLMAVYLSAHPVHHRKQRAHLVRITCLARGSAVVVEGEGGSLDAALDDALAQLEREVARMRERRHERHPSGALAS